MRMRNAPLVAISSVKASMTARIAAMRDYLLNMVENICKTSRDGIAITTDPAPATIDRDMPQPPAVG